MGVGHYYAYYFRKKSRLKKLPLLKRYKNIKKNVNILGYVILFLDVVITIYLYLFSACPEHLFKYLWIFILFLSLLPLLIYFILHYYEYDEKKKNYAAAKIYYQEIADDFSDTSWASKALKKIREVSGKE